MDMLHSMTSTVFERAQEKFATTLFKRIPLINYIFYIESVSLNSKKVTLFNIFATLLSIDAIQKALCTSHTLFV